MQRSYPLVTVVALFATTATLFGQNAANRRFVSSTIDRNFLRSDMVVDGHVVGFEDELAEAQTDGGPIIKVRVAVIEIKEVFKGPRNLTHLRVACLASDQGKVNKKGKIQTSTIVRHPLLSPIADDESGIFYLEVSDSPCLFGLTKSSTIPDSQSPRFKEETSALRDLAEILDDPLKAISGKDELENYTKLYRYLFFARQTSSSEAASPKLSKRILTMLAEMSPTGIDRDKAPYGFSSYAIKLRLTSADGFELPIENGRPVSGTKRYEAMHVWIKKNAKSHRLRLNGP